MRTRTLDWWQRAASCFVLFVAVYLVLLPGAALGQEVGDEVRVPTSYANIHMGPSSGQQVLVLAPEDYVLRVTGRRGEWIEVELDPELKKLGMKIRWYENEERGWMHESTVEVVEHE